jgi:hypothetical protein
MPWNGLPPGLTNPPRPLQDGDDEEKLPSYGWMGPAPGTMILVLIFLAAFAVYYFTNWKLLSFVWKIG